MGAGGVWEGAIMKGSVGILNVGAGDTKLSFDPTKPSEIDHAKKVVTDMLRRGYAILVHVGERDGKPLYHRAEAFDPATCEYLIAGLPTEYEPALPPEAKTSRRGRKTITRIPAATTRATAVARSAGG